MTDQPMSETKKIFLGVVGGVLAIVVTFTLIVALVGKGDFSPPKVEEMPVRALFATPAPTAEAPVPEQTERLKPVASTYDPTKSVRELRAHQAEEERNIKQEILDRLAIAFKREESLRETQHGTGEAAPKPASSSEAEGKSEAPASAGSNDVAGTSHESSRLGEGRNPSRRDQPSTVYTPPRRKRYRQSTGPGVFDGIPSFSGSGPGMGGRSALGGHFCGAMTLKGSPCGRWVVNGVHCYQHGG
jgi:hypothetical protein